MLNPESMELEVSRTVAISTVNKIKPDESKQFKQTVAPAFNETVLESYTDKKGSQLIFNLLKNRSQGEHFFKDLPKGLVYIFHFLITQSAAIYLGRKIGSSFFNPTEISVDSVVNELAKIMKSFTDKELFKMLKKAARENMLTHAIALLSCANFNINDKDDYGPFASALRNCSIPMTAVLITAGVDYASYDLIPTYWRDGGFFPHVDKGEAKLVEYLIQRGAEVNPTLLNKNDKTPLQSAVESGNPKMIALLLSKGADHTKLSDKERSGACQLLNYDINRENFIKLLTTPMPVTNPTPVLHTEAHWMSNRGNNITDSKKRNSANADEDLHKKALKTSQGKVYKH